MKSLLKAIQGWLKRNKIEEMPSKSMKSQEGDNEIGVPRKGESLRMVEACKGPVCIYCKGDYWGDQCTSYESVTKRRQLIVVGPDVRANIAVEAVSNARANITLILVINP